MFTFKPMDETNALTIQTWRYPPPYDIYNLNSDKKGTAIEYFLDPANRFFSILDESDELVGFCSFGPDGQVPGGNYQEEALDIGMGIRPDLTGQGQGSEFVQAILQFAQEQFALPCFRVTIAGFNRRAIHVWAKSGFRPIQTFEKTNVTGDVFVVMTREAF